MDSGSRNVFLDSDYYSQWTALRNCLLRTRLENRLWANSEFLGQKKYIIHLVDNIFGAWAIIMSGGRKRLLFCIICIILHEGWVKYINTAYQQDSPWLKQLSLSARKRWPLRRMMSNCRTGPGPWCARVSVLWTMKFAYTVQIINHSRSVQKNGTIILRTIWITYKQSLT